MLKTALKVYLCGLLAVGAIGVVIGLSVMIASIVTMWSDAAAIIVFFVLVIPGIVAVTWVALDWASTREESPQQQKKHT